MVMSKTAEARCLDHFDLKKEEREGRDLEGSKAERREGERTFGPSARPISVRCPLPRGCLWELLGV